MKRGLAIFLAVIVIFSVFGVMTFAADTNPVKYYDENGNEITVNGLYYNRDGCPMYNAGCYYIGEDGNPVYVGGCRAYYYNADGDLAAGEYYYNADGKAVAKPLYYPRGWGCGTYYYDSQGNAVNGSYYYDDFGNPVETPTNPALQYRGRGGCCRGGW